MTRLYPFRYPTIKNLAKLVRIGHIPCRFNEPYTIYLGANPTPAYGLVNCFTHSCYNLSNEELSAINFDYFDKENMRGFSTNPHASKERIKDKIFDFVGATGLEVCRSSPHAVIKNNQWIVSLYFNEGLFKDYHFMLRESDGTWSSKEGFSSEVNYLSSLPKEHDEYEYFDSYCITNPYANETIKDYLFLRD